MVYCKCATRVYVMQAEYLWSIASIGPQCFVKSSISIFVHFSLFLLNVLSIKIKSVSGPGPWQGSPWTRSKSGGPWTRGPCFVLTLIFQLIFPPFHLDFILYSIKCSEYFWSELIFQVLKYKTWLKWQMIPKSEVKRKGYFKRQEIK